MEAVGFVAAIIDLVETLTKAVRYLNAIKNAPKERWDLLVQATDLSARLVKLRSKYEDSSTQPGNPWNEGMQSLGPILDLFEKQLQVIVKKLEEGSSFKKAIQRFTWPFDQKTIGEVLNQMQRVKILIVLAYQDDLRQLSLAIKDDTKVLPKLAYLMEDTNDQVTQLREDEDTSKAQAITDWFSQLDFLTIQAEVFAIHQPNTGTWFIDHALFQKWIGSPGEILWAPGIPGAGKTVMVSIVANHLRKKYASDPRVRVGVAYCLHRDPQTQSLPNILCGLWRQIIVSEVNHPKSVKDLYNSCTEERTRPSIEQILDVLQEEISKHERVFMVIDALDELPSSTCKKLITQLLTMTHKVNLLCTSRNVDTIAGMFSQTPTIEISAQEKDMTSLIEAQIHQNDKLTKIMKRHPDLHSETITTIVEKAQNMFLLVKLYLDMLATQLRVGDYRRALLKLPVGLNATYEAAMHRIQQIDSTKTGIRILYWVAFAARPLELPELDHALAIKPGDKSFDDENLLIEDITSLCAGLVEISPDHNGIRLAHYTTYIYLKDNAQTLYPTYLDNMLSSCLTYLSFDELVERDPSVGTSIKELLVRYPFLEYAAANWSTYYEDLPEPDQQIKNTVLDFLQLDHGSSDVLMYNHPMYRSPPMYGFKGHKVTGLHLATALSMTEEMRKILEIEGYNNHQSKWVSSPLDWAAYMGRCDLAAILLDAGADPSHSSPAPVKALHLAAFSKRVDMVRLLLERGADPNIRIGAYLSSELSELPGDQTAMHAACWNNQIEMARVLVEHGADVNMGLVHEPSFTPIQCLLEKIDGRTALFDYLIEHGANIVMGGAAFQSMRQQPLWFLQMLISSGLELNQRNEAGNYALDVALESQEKDKVKLLLDNGAISGRTWREDNELITIYKDEDWYDLLEQALSIVDTKLNISPDLSQKRSEELCFTSSDRETSYLDVTIPDTINLPISRLVISTESHDQGWSDYPDNHNTYRDSQTWFELRVTDNGILQRHPHRFQSNVHASSQWRRHVSVFDRDVVSGNVLQLMDDLKPGVDLKLYARAEYDGWVNHVKSAKIELFGRRSGSPS